MKRSSGFTLIELMITVVVIAILVAIALPSYQTYIARGVRSAGQQFLTDLAQRQEQYFLDVRQYATGIGTAAGQLNITMPDAISTRYQAPLFTVNNAAVPPTYTMSLTPIPGSVVTNDGALYINNLDQRWRETDGNGVFDTAATTTNCAWDNKSCRF